MIRDVERFHGAVLARLVRHGGGSHQIRCYKVGRSSYVIDEVVGLYIKYSASRMSPWTFSFTAAHHHELDSLLSEIGALCVVLVCGEDGVVTLNAEELGQILDGDVEGVEWVRADRRPREKYAISGSDGRLRLKVGDGMFPQKLFDAARRQAG